jgi:hypothetical protein
MSAGAPRDCDECDGLGKKFDLVDLWVGETQKYAKCRWCLGRGTLFNGPLEERRPCPKCTQGSVPWHRPAQHNSRMVHPDELIRECACGRCIQKLRPSPILTDKYDFDENTKLTRLKPWNDPLNRE